MVTGEATSDKDAGVKPVGVMPVPFSWMGGNLGTGEWSPWWLSAVLPLLLTVGPPAGSV